jgi:CheY-like chemotaxis protein
MARILIADDDENIRILWRRNLQETGCVIDEAESIESAIEQMRRVPPPDILLLDLRLSDSNEDATLATIRLFKEIHPEALIIVATGYATDQIRARAAKFGADDFCEKLDLNSQAGLAKCLWAAIARHPRGSRESVEALGEFQEALSKLLPA